MTEITWSLMHPTPLDVGYMKKVIEHSKNYRVDSFEICAECHSNLGGMDGLADYSSYPETCKAVDKAAVEANRNKLREIIKLAHDAGKPVYYWHREAMVPDGLLADRPALLDENGEFDLLGEEYASLLRHKIDSSFKQVPELDGLVLTLTEASYSIIHNSNTEKFPPQKVVAHIVRIFAAELAARNKRFILRSFGSIAKDYEDIIAGAEEVAEEFGFEIETKITPYDFDPFLPVNPFLRSVPGATLGAECDCLGEFLGAGMLPAENVDNIVNYVRSGTAAGVNRYAIRLDRIGNNVFDCYEINLYAYARAIDDPSADADTIRREWLEAHAPESAREVFREIGIEGFHLVEKNNFINGNVIFHQFPSGYTLKYLKAGFIFALFKNGVSLKNGAGVWSILSDDFTPGREAILREKDEAVVIAEKCYALLKSLPREAGFEKEYEWRERLWENALKVTRLFKALTACVCAYFDDMEKGDESAAELKKAVDDARAECLRVAPDMDVQKVGAAADSYNGLEKKLFRVSNNVTDIYAEPFSFICGLLLKEYELEFSARQKLTCGSTDAVLCASLVDEWRVARYMHAGNAMIVNGHQCRWAGNTMFPNGFLDMELKRETSGGKLVVYGEVSQTVNFACGIDGAEPVNYKFDENGSCVIPLAPGGESVKVRLQKAPGPDYPLFIAVVVMPE